ncbi:MAG: ribonuclease HII [Alphaproteobacteria bacterium]|nr:ribonuclease HII [Alphaproteobacteria bacterium]
MADFALELAAPVRPVAGIDESGRGPLAGPVVAAAVVLLGRTPRSFADLDDSKMVPPAARAGLYRRLRRAEARGTVLIGVGQASVEEIDCINILRATLLAMRRAVDALPGVPAFALVDGNFLPDLPCPGRFVIGGDGISLSIAAASIVAKQTRDTMMHALARDHPDYGWETNVGYGTRAHVEALRRLGPTPHHRRSFAPVRTAPGRAGPNLRYYM